MGVWKWVWLIFFCTWLASIIVLPPFRARQMKKLAARMGFRYLGDVVPQVSLVGTQLERMRLSMNVIEGERSGLRVIAFDCWLGEGKNHWRRTVIAARTNLDVFAATDFDTWLTTEKSDGWTILYRPRELTLLPRGLMPVAELEAHIESISQ
jgi:hypothetical protein